MKKFGIILAVLASIFVLFIILASIFYPVLEDPPDIKGEIGALVYSSSGWGKEDCYLIFLNEMPEPVRAPAKSVVRKFSPEIEKPMAKIWIKEKENAKRAEIWFRDEEQFREYLR